MRIDDLECSMFESPAKRSRPSPFVLSQAVPKRFLKAFTHAPEKAMGTVSFFGRIFPALVLVRQQCERQKCERHQCEANSANANSAKGSTVRMRQECECQMCECQQCDATSVRKKCDSSANDNGAKRTLCRDMHARLYRQKPEFWDRQSHFSPLI